MGKVIELPEALIATWRTSNRVTEVLFEQLPDEVWPLNIPGAPRRTVRMIAGHLHNSRCTWIKTTGRRHGVEAPPGVDRFRVTREELLPALAQSSHAIAEVIRFGLDHGGKVPGFPRDAVHFVAYLVAHEGHHRGQIIMVARQLGHRLPAELTTRGMWDWSARAKESAASARR